MQFSVQGSYGFCFYPGMPRDFDVALLVRGDGGVLWNPHPANITAASPTCNKTTVPCYVYSGEDITVTVEKIRADVTFLPDSVTIYRGDTVTFSASITPTHFDGVQVPFGISSYWVFHPDVGSPQSVCLPNMAVCNYVPSKSGTMKVSVIAQGDSLAFSSRVTVLPRLTVSCLPASPTRAETVTCTASTVGNVPFSVSRWKFEPADSALSAITVIDPADVWSGAAVTSGIVSVVASISGVSDTALASIGVESRGWSWTDGSKWNMVQDTLPLCTFYQSFLIDSTGSLPGDGTLGVNRDVRSCIYGPGLQDWIQPSATVFPDSGAIPTVVSTGPNQGLWYIGSAHYRIQRASELNPSLGPNGAVDSLTHGDDLSICRAALGLGPTDPVIVNFYTYNKYCQYHDIDLWRSLLLAHEFMGTKVPNTDWSVANGHQARAYIGARLPENDPYQITEPLVRASRSHLVSAVSGLVSGANERIEGWSDVAHLHVYDNVGTHPSCMRTFMLDMRYSPPKYQFDMIVLPRVGGNKCQ